MEKTETPLVSIIMPAHNAERTIAASIKSVLDQTYNDWELIIMDDASTDNTAAIVREAMAIHETRRIILVGNEKNYGVSETRNRGTSRASGKWIAFLDSDDLWRSDKLAKQIKATQQRNDVDLVFTGSSFINSSGTASRYILEVPKAISYHELLKQNVISCSSVLVKKELIQKYPMKRDDMHEDYAVWLQLLRDGYHAYGINEPLLIYRLSESSKSGNKKKAAAMTYKVYRFMGLNRVQTLYYFSCYAWRNLKKYFHINNSL